jgi:hypothetical protein
MIHISPHLLINRLVVVKHNGSIAFDENFHNGVNIIRGQNSSGKSTIANFIFYILGGDYNNWTTEALRCRDVIAEVKINGIIITLKRHITDGGMQPMSIFWGNYEQSRQDSINWQTFPYKQNQNNNTASFTNVLFNLLSFPEVKNEADSNITMHQILRLLYIDQDTPTQSLFRLERFDLPLTRQAISEVLLGVYDDSLYFQRLAYRNAIKETDEKKKQFDGINRIYGQTGAATNLNTVYKEIELTQAELTKIDTSILELKQQNIVRTTKSTLLSSEKIQSELMPLKNKIRETNALINQFEFEISDSKQFINTLKKRVDDLNSSLLAKRVLGELPLTHCPQCLSPLENETAEGHCFLCKQPLTEEAERANAKRLKQEMELQINESASMLEEKERTLVNLKGELPNQTEKARALQKQLDLSIESGQTTRDDRIDALLISKGGIEKRIEYLTQQIKGVEMLELLKKELEELARQTQSLRLEISQKEEQQKQKYQIALHKIREFTLYILKNDLDRQEEFNNGKNVEVNFQKDSYSLDDGNNFSASSKIYFKNAILFSIFFASLDLEFFRYPRFILCDNMEDKGMEKERSQNFQNLITSISARYQTEHQIIFTTSMISNELDNTNYCVGDSYTRHNKTLKI